MPAHEIAGLKLFAAFIHGTWAFGFGFLKFS